MYSAYKICKGCGKRKLKSHFRKNKDAKDGYRNYCKACQGTENIYPFFTKEVQNFCKHHRFSEVRKFGFFYGILVYLRRKEVLAFSVVDDSQTGSKVCKTADEGREFLYCRMIIAGEKTRKGVTR